MVPKCVTTRFIAFKTTLNIAVKCKGVDY